VALCYTILPALALGLTLSVHAQDVTSALSQSASQAAVCSGCHGKSSGVAIPALASDARMLEQQMLALRQEDGDSAMHRLLYAYDDAQIRGIAEALASLKIPPAAQSTGP
jgi:cytochrome c553